MPLPGNIKFPRGPIVHSVVASVASYMLVWLWVDITHSTFYYAPFLFFSAIVYLGLDVKIERKLKKSLIPMRERTKRFALQISIGAFIATLVWGIQYEAPTFATPALALLVFVCLYKAFRARYARITRLIGK